MDQLENQDGITAYHGSPHDFERFDLSKIGTGEGAQAFGHGLYFAQSEPVAEGYRDELSKNKPLPLKIDDKIIHEYTPMQRMVADRFGNVDKVIELMSPRWKAAEKEWHSIPTYAGDLERGLIEENYKEAQKQRAELEEMRGKNVGFGKRGHMYEVSINAHPDHFLDWDKPLHEQPYVMDKLIKAGAIKPDGSLSFMYNEEPRHGGEMYERLTSPMAKKLTGGNSQKHASEFLHNIGIKGIKYFDAGSRDAKEGSRNYVVFDDKLVTTKRKYARGGVVTE